MENQDQFDANENNEQQENETPEVIENSGGTIPPQDDGSNQLFQDFTNRDITEEMEKSYLTYAMSVIVSRALPDVRDGLKPVHRRILYVMHETGLSASAKFKKSATVVGDVLGKYHPHGDSAVYDAMVRMAQDFSLRYPLVKGQGNFGSVDGDSAAAYRYTEAKMEKITEELLRDIEKDTVDWRENYDGRLKEPTVLPTKLPQLLLNGSMGIAVGMATNIPPHNLGEVVDATVHLCDNPEATVEDLLMFVKGPDFPTGGKLYGLEDIKKAYTTGHGGMKTRAKTEIVERKGNKHAIIVHEIPYQVNKADLILKIAHLVRDKKISGITDIRDESNREGIRVVIDLKRETYPKKILNQLFKMTNLQTSFNLNMIALVDGIQPRVLNLKQVIEYFIKHRKEVIRRKTEFELRVAKNRAHILEGLKIALDNIDEIINTIRSSATKEDAHNGLKDKFKLSDIQAKAILDMRLQTLAGLERQKIDDEYQEKLALIAELEAILADPQKIVDIMKEELAELKAKYDNPRRTEIIPHAIGKISSKDTIPNEPMIVMLSKQNYIKRVTPNAFKAQNRGGKGVIGVTTKEEDEIKIIRHCMNHDNMLFFTNMGRVFELPVYEIQQASRTAKGQPIVNLLQLREGERVTAILKTGETLQGSYLFMATKLGTVKKTHVSEFKNMRKSGLIAIKLREGDSLEWVKLTDQGDQAVIVTKTGKSIRFNEGDVRPMGRPSMGVRGIRLKEGDVAVEMDVVKDPQKSKLLVVMENGLGKCTPLLNYREQTRGGTGVKTANITKKTGDLVGAKIITDDINGDLIMMSKQGQTIRLNLQNIPSQGRATQGVYLMRLKKGDNVASISLLVVPEAPEKKAEEDDKKDKKAQAELI